MMSKAPRWQETQVNSHSNKPAQKTGGKEPAASAAPVSGGAKQGSNSSSRPIVRPGRSNSLGRSVDSSLSSSRAGGSLKRGSQQSLVSQQGGRAASRPDRAALRLCSSRSFSSLNTSSLTAAPFTRSSRSLSRLDQRPSRDDSNQRTPTSQAEKGKSTENKPQSSGQLIRPHTDPCQGDDGEKIKTCASPETAESSPCAVSTSECHHHCNKVKKQSRDGVYTLCAMTSGMRRNLVHAVLKNVRPGSTHDVTGSASEQQPPSHQSDSLKKTEHTHSLSGNCAEETQDHQKEERFSLPCPADKDSGSSVVTPPFSPNLSPIQAGQGASCFIEVTQTGESTTMPLNEECLDKGSNMRSEEKQVSIQQRTLPLIKELELTKRELSRLQNLNRNLQDELRQQREGHTPPQVDPTNGSSEQALQRLQKMNHDLRSELEALKRSQEEAREAELRRRVDLLAQQAQLLVTGDATALAQAHLEQDRRRFQEQRVEWERCVSSLKSQLSAAEEQRKEAEVRFMQLQQEVQGYRSLQEEAEHLKKNLQDMKSQLQANEEAQAQKEARLEKHLMLLQASQDRERRSLAASLAQAEKHSEELQQRLDQAEEQVGSLSKTQTWTKEIETAQQQLQEELTCTVSAVQKLQEERKQLERRCEELQSQLSEADGEVGRLQSRLNTDETHYYNLEHTYERVCEELQVVLGKLKQKEADTQDIREGYERLLDRKEQELSEVLLKMEVLGNSLEETEVKLSEMMKACTCCSSQQRDESSGDQSADPLRVKADSSNADDPERFMSVIQTLETKLFVTEEKLRNIMQRLEEEQGHTGCQDPHLCSQLTQSRANAQHLSLLLHSQAKQSHRFAQVTENRCRMLLGRFQVGLNIVQACREKLQTSPINITEFERQLASAAACLQQGEKDAEKQVHEARNAGRGEDKILNDEAAAERKPSEEESVGKCLMREVFVIEKMVSALENQHGLTHSASGETEEDFALKFRDIISQRIALISDRMTQSGGAECENSESVESSIYRVCAEAELTYSAIRLQQQHESRTNAQSQGAEQQRKGLADINPPELAPYEGRSSEEVKKIETEEEPEWIQRLILRLQRRAECLRQLCRETSADDAAEGSVDVNTDLSRIQEQVKMIYLSERLFLDFEHQSVKLKEKLHTLCKDKDTLLKKEQETLNHTLCQLQEDNNALREELERAELKIISVETGNHRLLKNMQEIEDYHEERMNKLEADFQEKITELQQIHEEEMKYLHGYYTKSCFKETQSKSCCEAPVVTDCSSSSSADQTVTKQRAKEELRQEKMGGDSEDVHEKLEAPCDEGLTSLEEMHRQLIGDLQRQHEQEVEALLKEKDHLLQEETAATMAAIVAMRRAHKQELVRSRRSQHIKESADITQLHMEHEKELQMLQKELEVLSVQHTQKCLETSQLNKELQEERQSSMQYQRENQELKKQQRETDEMAQQYFSLNGNQPDVAAQGSDFYEMEVMLRAREAEMQFLRQEARSLREELKIARMDKLYAQNKLKALYTSSPDEPDHDVNKHCDDFNLSTLSPDRDAAAQSLDDTSTNTNTNNAAFPKKTEKPPLTRQVRGLSPQSLTEGLSALERMKLFES